MCGARLADARPRAVQRRRVGARAARRGGARNRPAVRRRDLEFDALALLGEAYVASGRVAEGMTLLDEAMAAVSGGEVVGRRRDRRDLLPAAGRLRARRRRAARRAVDGRGRPLRGLERLRAADLPLALRRDPDRARPLGGGRGRSCSPRSARSRAATARRACCRWSGSRSCACGRGGSRRRSACWRATSGTRPPGGWRRRSRWREATSRLAEDLARLCLEGEDASDPACAPAARAAGGDPARPVTLGGRGRRSIGSPGSPRAAATIARAPAPSSPPDGCARPAATSELPATQGGVEGFAALDLPLEAARAQLELARALASRAPDAARRRGASRARDVRAPGRAPRRRRGGRACCAGSGRPAARLAEALRSADQARDRGAVAAGRRVLERGDRRAPCHQPADRGAPRRQHPVQAGPAQPRRGGRLRGTRTA